MTTINHAGHEYKVVMDEPKYEMFDGYRETHPGHIEIITGFSGMVRTAEIHIDTFLKILVQREHDKAIAAALVYEKYMEKASVSA